ncbi:MAG: radical SAM/SPASM domain-containing protein [Thalassospira sp.]|uniref:radical SAM/SPASM domain-containing protein n=2 Tax=Thalassospira sp. TaxID=1912094 RepID=UPI0032EC09DE
MMTGNGNDRKNSLLKRFSNQYIKSKTGSVLTTLPPVPKNMMVELSNACNHACIFCTSPNMTRKISRINSGLLDDIMRQGREIGVDEIGFYTTGEPFVHKDLEKFIARASELGYRYIYISTNGALATPDRAKKAIDAGLNSIKFSINAGTKEAYKLVHGYDDWDKVMSNLKFISSYRKEIDRPLNLFVTYIVTKQSAPQMEVFKEEVSHLVDEILFHPVHNQSGQMNDTKDKLSVEQAQKSFKTDNICMMPFNRLHVTCEGFLTLCCVDYQNYLVVGDLQKQSLLDAWGSPVFQDMRQRHLDQNLKGTLCGNCWLGCKDKIDPVTPEAATILEMPNFYEETAEKVQERIEGKSKKYS